MTIYNFLVGHPERWTTMTMARTAAGTATTPECSTAVCFCLGALVQKFYPNNQSEIRVRIEKAIQELFGSTKSPVAFNDDKARIFDEIVQVVKRAEV